MSASLFPSPHRFFGLLGIWGFGLFLVLGSRVASAQTASCQVHAIHATKSGTGQVPKELKFMEAQLKDDQFAAYRGFTLLETKQAKLSPEQSAELSIKSGHRLSLKLLGIIDGRIRLNVTLDKIEGSKRLLDTQYTILDRGLLLLGGTSYKEGKVLFAIGCEIKPAKSK